MPLQNSTTTPATTRWKPRENRGSVVVSLQFQARLSHMREPCFHRERFGPFSISQEKNSTTTLPL